VYKHVCAGRNKKSRSITAATVIVKNTYCIRALSLSERSKEETMGLVVALCIRILCRGSLLADSEDYSRNFIGRPDSSTAEILRGPMNPASSLVLTDMIFTALSATAKYPIDLIITFALVRRLIEEHKEPAPADYFHSSSDLNQCKSVSAIRLIRRSVSLDKLLL
jgi:hypothetical protein